MRKQIRQRFQHVWSNFQGDISSDRIENFPSNESMKILNRMQDKATVEELFASLFGPVDYLDRTDGLRITFDSGEVLHLRPSETHLNFVVIMRQIQSSE